MSDGAIFVVVFGGIFVLRIIAATFFFLCLLPEGDRCVNCDAPTLRVQRRWQRLAPWLRPSWCLECEWHGMLRTARPPLAAPPRGPAGTPVLPSAPPATVRRR
jgi:hypothetical protein